MGGRSPAPRWLRQSPDGHIACSGTTAGIGGGGHGERDRDGSLKPFGISLRITTPPRTLMCNRRGKGGGKGEKKKKNTRGGSRAGKYRDREPSQSYFQSRSDHITLPHTARTPAPTSALAHERTAQHSPQAKFGNRTHARTHDLRPKKQKLTQQQDQGVEWSEWREWREWREWKEWREESGGSGGIDNR